MGDFGFITESSCDYDVYIYDEWNDGNIYLHDTSGGRSYVNAEDIPKLINALQKAYEYIKQKEQS
jgi:hypothetical protein